MLAVLLCLCLQDAVSTSKLIEQLGSDDPEIREQATVALVKRGVGAFRELEKASESANPEVALRARLILAKIPARDRYEACLPGLKADDPADQVRIGEHAIGLGLYEEGFGHFDRAYGMKPGLRKTLQARMAACADEMMEAAMAAYKDGDAKKGGRLYRLVIDRCGREPDAMVQRLYTEGYAALVKRRDQKQAFFLFRLAIEDFGHTRYMKTSVPPGNKTRTEIITSLLRALGR